MLIVRVSLPPGLKINTFLPSLKINNFCLQIFSLILADVLLIGDANKENLLDIWNGDKMREIRIKHLKGKRFEFSPCSSCSFNEMSDNDYIDTYAKKILSRIEKI